MKSHRQSGAIIKAVKAAGGQVEITAKGHIRVKGPAGVAIVPSAPSARGYGKANLRGTLRREAGIEITL
jgi:hypothetical protein